MNLRFIKNYQILEVTKASELELEQLQITLTEKGYNFIQKKSYEKCLFANFKYIPAGLWQRVYQLKKKNWSVNIENLTDYINTEYGKDYFYEWCESLELKYKPRGYQIEAAYLAYKFRIGKIAVGTGGGKSLTQYLLARFVHEHFLKDDEKILLVVPKVMLCNQMHSDFNEYQMSNEPLIIDRIYGGSRRTENANVVVGNIDSLVNYDLDFFSKFRYVMFDEGHKMGTSKSYQTILHYIDREKLLMTTGLSGTFHTKGIDALVQDAYLGPTIIDLKSSELQELKAISNVKIKVAELRYDSEISKRYYFYPGIDDLKSRYRAELEFIRSIEFRTKFIIQVTEKLEGNQVLLFNSKDNLRRSKAFAEQYLTNKQIFEISGDIPESERTEIKKLMETTDNILVFATYATLDTGVSINNLLHLHFVDSCKSFIRVVQSIGRALRLHENKDYATIWDWVDVFKKEIKEWLGPAINISYRHSKQRQKIYTDQKYPFEIKRLNIR